jgi:predicted HNH restriction endonuclease
MANKQRNDTNKKTVKEQLFQCYGEVCMVCEKSLSRKYLTLHHIIKYEHSHITTFKDSSLVCTWCHHNINLQERKNVTEYTRLNNNIREYKATH